MKRAYSVANVLNAKFNVLPFKGRWLDLIGEPELTGTWFIYGDSKNGKTSFAMQLAKYLTNFGRVGYNAVEEGLCKTTQDAYVRADMMEVAGKIVMIDKESVSDLHKRLLKRKSPQFIFIDTAQFWELSFHDYKKLKAAFPNKLFIYISHVDGRKPDGTTAIRIWRDASVAIRIEGFKAFPVSRYGGKEPYVINEQLANEYWGSN
jgi:predicted CopG family antitoxin